MPRRRAFTMLELTVVLVITVTISGIGMVRYVGALATYRVDLAARRLAADLEQVRREARATGMPYFFEISQVKSQYRHGPDAGRTIAAELAPTRAERPVNVLLTDAPYRVSITAVTWSGAGAYLTFNGYGVPSQSVRVQLSAGDRTRRISLDASGGNITIE